MAGSRAVAVGEVVRWLEDEINRGRFEAGDPLPSERDLSQRLKVSRSAIREAKALLCGRGVLIQDRLRSKFLRRDAASLFHEWVERVAAPGAHDQLRRTREALALRRLVWPQTTALAVRRSQDKLVEAFSMWAFLIAARASPRDMAATHVELLQTCAALAGSPLLVALTAAVSQSVRSLPLFETAHDSRSTWLAALDETNAHLKARRATAARSALRRHLQRLDQRLIADLKGRQSPLAFRSEA
jgi:DNA-binding FadR family transcriptional regulator